MSQEWDRRVMPEFLQTTIAVWFGAAYQGIEMMKSPQQSMNRMLAEARTLLTVPDDAGEGIQNKAQAVAAVWMEKGATLFEHWKASGRKFTEGA